MTRVRTKFQHRYSRNESTHGFSRLLSDIPDFELSNRVDGTNLGLREKTHVIQCTAVCAVCTHSGPHTWLLSIRLTRHTRVRGDKTGKSLR